MESGLWAKEKLPFSIDFFHPGWTAKKMVTMHEVVGRKIDAAEVRSESVRLRQTEDPGRHPASSGLCGLARALPPELAGLHGRVPGVPRRELFPGDPGELALWTCRPAGFRSTAACPACRRSFPVFTEFYLQRPEKDAKSLTAWALLEGESVAGAYQFTITPGAETVMDIEAEITLRSPVQQLGLAPFSSMYWFGEGTHPKPCDFRPEVHDSDGLLMELESGNLHYRPLEHTHNQFRHCVFTMEKPRSWSLLQRDRSFSSYQDIEARYHDRPSVRVEPVQGFDYGKLHLIEMPTIDETGDNVILVWDPQPGLEVGKPFHFHYRLRWMRDPAPSGLFAVRATRSGTPVQKPDQILMAIDFAKPLQPEAKVGDPKWDDITGLKPVVTLNQQDVKLIHVGHDRHEHGQRGRPARRPRPQRQAPHAPGAARVFRARSAEGPRTRST